jgi:hypothetical protein
MPTNVMHRLVVVTSSVATIAAIVPALSAGAAARPALPPLYTVEGGLTLDGSVLVAKIDSTVTAKAIIVVTPRTGAPSIFEGSRSLRSGGTTTVHLRLDRATVARLHRAARQVVDVLLKPVAPATGSAHTQIGLPLLLCPTEPPIKQKPTPAGFPSCST